MEKYRKEKSAMKLSKELLKLPTKEVLGKLCWSPKTCAKVIGGHKNTIINWAQKTKQGLLDMPLISAPVPGSPIHIPREEFVKWMSHGKQN